jgi:NAD(P)-dependent dehydrogenase (short-subunit alcohol dehydrogenase family)
MTLLTKAALVTGGSRGIGFATAARLLRDGASVAILGTQPEGLADARGRLERLASPDRVAAVRCDVRDADAVTEAAGEAAARFGGLDILVNSAGIGLFAPVSDMSPAQWRQVLDTNVTGVFHACRAVLPHLRARGGGWIINISSLASTGPFAKGAAYCASKAALNAFSDALMQEVRYEGIRVACVLPGSVNTTFGGHASTKSEWALMPEDVAEVIGDLLAHPSRSLPSRVEIRPAQPQKKV